MIARTHQSDVSNKTPFNRHIFAICRRVRHIADQLNAAIAANLEESGYGG